MYKIRLFCYEPGPNAERLWYPGAVVRVPDDIGEWRAETLIQTGRAEIVDNAPLVAGDTIGDLKNTRADLHVSRMETCYA